jgi:2-iminoacetate synthase ThiH
MREKRTIAVKPEALLNEVLSGRELTAAEAGFLLQLSREDDLHALRQAANTIRQRQVGDSVFYRSGMSLYLTNCCELAPVLYHYPKVSGDTGSYIATIDYIDEILEQARRVDVRQFYLSGGGYCSSLNIPGLEAPTVLKTYIKVFSYVKAHLPFAEISAFSPDEIDFLSIVSGKAPSYLLELFQDLGMQALGSHGSEILVDSVRQKISPKKATVKRWFEIVFTACRLGLRMPAPLEVGPLETLPQRVTHLERLLRFSQANFQQFGSVFLELQPRMWTELPATLSYESDTQPHVRHTDRLKLTAVMRLLLGEYIPHQQIFWQPTKGEREAQEALEWGANGLGSTDALSYQAFLSGVPLSTPQEYHLDDFKSLIEEVGRLPVLSSGSGKF